MEVIITGKNLEITPRVRQYVDKKMETLQRHFKSVPVLVLQVVLSEENTKSAEKRFVVEFTTNVGDSVLRAEERGQDLHVAIDRASEVIDRQIERLKGRREARRRPGASLKSPEVPEAAEMSMPEGEYDSRVSRVKKHMISPMSVEEAIDQMELLGHDFFLFLNRHSEQLNVVYRRKEGDYGLIEPRTE